MSLNNFFKSITGTAPALNVSFSPESRLKLIEIPSNDDDKNKKNEFVPVYQNGANVSGHVDIILPDGFHAYEYDEIAVYLVGHVLCDDIDQDKVFLSHKITLQSKPGKLTRNIEYNFKFNKPKLRYNSFYGSLFKCRYFVRAIINRSKLFQSNIKKDQDLMVCNLNNLPPSKPLTMQVGVDNCLHIKFKYDNINISTHGYLSGHVKILSNTLKISSMQIQLIRREMIKTIEINKPEVISTNILGKFEIMDGFPGDGEEIPIRMFLQRFAPITCTQINNDFSVRYYANLGLIDCDGRRYFKTAEIQLFRTKIL